MSNQKILSDAVKLIFEDYARDKDGLRAMRRINMVRINLIKSNRLNEARLFGSVKRLILK